MPRKDPNPTYNYKEIYPATYKLAEGLTNSVEAYKKYTPEQFIDMLQLISNAETGNKNIVQRGGGPGRGYYQMEKRSSIVAKKRANNIINDLKNLGYKEQITLPNFNEDFTKLSKDEQGFYALSNMIKAASSKRATNPNAYINPIDAENAWLNYHWAGKAEDKPARQKHWQEVNNNPTDTLKDFYTQDYDFYSSEHPTDKSNQSITPKIIDNPEFIKGAWNNTQGGWLDKFDEGGKISKRNKNSDFIPPSYNPYFDSKNKPTVYLSNDRSNYDPIANNIYFNPNNNPQSPEELLKHEGYHWGQNLFGEFQYPEVYPGPLRRPQTPIDENNPLIPAYFNAVPIQAGDAMNYMLKGRNAEGTPKLKGRFSGHDYDDVIINSSPSLQFVPRDVIWNGVNTTRDGKPVYIPGADALQYSLPETIEGDAQSFEYYAPDFKKPIMGIYDLQDTMQHKQGGLIKRADGHYSRRGLWDNIRANRGSGRKPTAAMLEQERKIKKHDDGSWVKDSSIPTPTTPSFYEAYPDRTLTNYQMGTDKAPMYAAGSTVFTKQNSALWVNGGKEIGTQDKRYPSRNTRSLNPNRYTIGDVIPTGMDYKTPAAGTHDYSQDIQPYHTMRLHAPDTTKMGDGGGVNYNDKFNTKLKGKELEAFNYHSNLFKNLLNDTYDYDTKGFYNEVYNKYNGDLEAITKALTPGSPTQHIGTDRFKKPNHPTFSNESKYSIPIIRPGGKWGHDEEGDYDYFVAKKRNIKNMNASDGSPLEYFKRAEDYNQDGTPDVKLFYKGAPMFKRGGHIKKHINSPRVYGSPVNPNGMSEGPSMQRGGMMFAEGSTVGGEDKVIGTRGPNDNIKVQVDPTTGMPITTLKGVEVTADAPWYQYSQMFNLDNPDIPNKEAFVDQQKKKYLQYGDPGLLKGLGVTYENFPKEVEENYANQYDYLKNSYIMEKYAQANPYVDLESRGDWVEKLTPGYKNLLANSKYGSILQPNAWSKSLSGAQQLVNTFLPGKPLQFNIPGMTSSELKEANESNLSGLETLSFFPILGRNIANYGKNRGLSTGSNFRQLPGFFSGENMPNVNETEVMAFDPFSYAGLEAIPETIFNAGKGILNAPKFIKSKFAKLPKPAGPTGVQLSQQEEALLQGTNVGKNVEKLNVDLGSTTQELPIDIFDNAAILDAYKLPEYQSITGLDYEDLIHLFNTDKDAFYKITEAHKAKYCAPGSPCAKSSNQITQSIWNKLKTGEPFDYNGNAADAWYSKDQITKNGGQTIYDSKIDGDLNNLKIEDLQIGDQVLMGPDGNTVYPKVDPNTGLIKEENVSHRATIVGVNKNGYPVILESGLGESLIPVPIHENIFYKNNSNYGIRSIVRPKQFIGAQDKIMNTLVKGSQIDAPTNIKFAATTDAAKAYKDIFEGTQLELSHTLNLNQDELIQVFRAVVGIGEQESKLGGLSNAPALTKAKIIVKDLLERKGLTPYVKDMANMIKKAGKTFFDASYNPALKPFPGSAKVEMEAYKLVNSGKASNLKEGIELLYNTKYNRPSKFILNTTKPSSGVFKQKEISPSGKLLGLRDNKKSIKDILNTPVTELLLKSTLKEAQLKGAMANFTDIMSKIKKNNPTWSNQKVFDMAIQSWNSPTKANSSELVDFFYHGIDNPNPQQIGFDYLTKVRRNMDTLLPITDVRKAATPSFRPVFTHKDGGYVQNNNSNAWLDQYN